MVHPATQRAVRETLAALNTAIDIGFVFPPRTEGERGRGVWTGKDLDPGAVMALMSRAAAANAQGAHIYMRLGPSSRTRHPGIVMLDDLDAEKAKDLVRDGLEPFLVVETSPKNVQCWVRLVERGAIPYDLVHSLLRELAERYGADPRAVSPLQPGRLPGFTNRKPKYRQPTGNFPFVRLIEARPGMIASSGPELVSRALHQSAYPAQAGRARGNAPETPHKAAKTTPTVSSGIWAHLDTIHKEQKARIEREVAEGSRAPNAASQSEIDFAVAKAGSEEGIEYHHIAAWLSRTRPEKDPSYPERTVSAAAAFSANRYRKP